MKYLLLSLLTAAVFAACHRADDNNPDDTPISPDSNGLHVVDGKFVADAAGNRLVLRGVNMGSAFADGFGTAEIPEIEKTGANAVRLVLQRQYDNSGSGTMTAAQVESLITSCIDKGMVPILELHDYTGTSDVSGSLGQATAWWTSGDMKPMLMKYQKSIIINIANEPDDGSANGSGYSSANMDAVRSLRAAGYSCPFMIDAPGWGKDPDFFVEHGKELMDADPLHNLIFSVHTYWPTTGAYGNYSDAQITTYLNNLGNSGLPVVLGEIAAVDDQDANGLRPINYKLIMRLCQQNQLGYLVWWWGFVAPEGSNNAESMTPDGSYNGLLGAGKIMAVTDVNSIKSTAKRAEGLK